MALPLFGLVLQQGPLAVQHPDGKLPQKELLQCWLPHNSTRSSDNLTKAYAKGPATERAMRGRFPDYQSRHKLRYP
jgi:hypothetical protein